METLESKGTFLVSERASIELDNFWYQLLLPLVDGHHTADEIVAAALPLFLPEGATVEDAIQAGAKAFYALNQMVQQGWIIDGEEQLPASLVPFCHTLNLDSNVASHRLGTTQVSVSFLGSVSTSELISILESLSIRVADEGNIEVVLTDDYLQPGLEAHNQNALQTNRPWILIKPSGTIPWIGPFFVPGKTGCWECLAHRLRRNRPIEDFIERHKGNSTPLAIPLASLNSTVQTTLNLAATEIFKWIVWGQNKRLEGNLLTYDTLALRMDSHALVKRPQCPSCGVAPNALNSKPLPIFLGRREKTFTADGGHRCLTPEETLRKYQHHISPITGVVRSLNKVSPQFSPLFHNYVARHHFAATFDNLESLRQNVTGRSAGKGKIDSQARASAMGEAIERYAGVFQGDEIRHKANYQQLGERAIHPNSCMNFSSAQYENRQQWNESCPSFFQRIPEPFDEEVEREWTPVWSLTAQDFKYLPTAYCYHGYPQQTSNPDCWADANGCAAGNTLEEAILQGFMELVERDCVALWWYNRIQHPAVDLDSFDEPYFQALKDCYKTLQRDLWVIDITSDLNIPTFAAISRRTDTEIEDILLGYGTHFDPVIAIGRALTEVNQILPAVLSSKADGTTQYLSYESLAIEWWKTATGKNHPYLLADHNIPTKVRTDYPQVASDDLLDDVKLCQQIVEERGLEMLVLEQTRPDIGLKVVKVIVPGLRHFWRRLGLGRLYEVPVQLGWLPTPLEEEQLNTFPMWM
jgi:ribosomal protein S12 methylthiotransferase accessory factor